MSMFSSLFRVIPINNEFCLRCPSAGVLTLAFAHLDNLRDADGNVSRGLYRTLFVLACLHHREGDSFGKAVGISLYELSNPTHNLQCVDDLFKLEEEEFKYFLFRVASELPFDVVSDWFDIIDAQLLITDKTKTDAKKD